MDSRKWGSVLAVDSNGHKPSGFGKAAGPTRTLHIDQWFAFFDRAHPAADCFCMGRGENGYALMVDAPHAQGKDGGPLSKPFAYEAEAERGIERILEG